MIWMDSYANIHALTLRWVTCEDDLTDWTDEALWPLVSHADLETMMWAMSAFMTIIQVSPRWRYPWYLLAGVQNSCRQN